MNWYYPFICSYMWDLISRAHIWCAFGFVLETGCYILKLKMLDHPNLYALILTYMLKNIELWSYGSTKNKIMDIWLVTWTLFDIISYPIYFSHVKRWKESAWIHFMSTLVHFYSILAATLTWLFIVIMAQHKLKLF